VTPVTENVNEILEGIAQGNRSAVPQLMSVLYSDLLAMASRFLGKESSQHTFQPTDLINECFLKLVDCNRVSWQGRTHFIAVSAQAMRRILVDHARTTYRQKRGGRNRNRVQLRDDLAITMDNPGEIAAVDQALEKLRGLDPLHSQILELRYFGGLGLKEVADALEISPRTVQRHWAMIRAWLLKQLNDSEA